MIRKCEACGIEFKSTDSKTRYRIIVQKDSGIKYTSNGRVRNMVPIAINTSYVCERCVNVVNKIIKCRSDR